MVRRLAALHPEDTLTAEIVEAELAEAVPPPHARDRQDARASCRRWWSATWPATSPATAASCRRPGSTTASCSTWSGPLLIAALAATRGNQIRAAALLGLNRNTLRKKIRDLDIQVFRTPAA